MGIRKSWVPVILFLVSCQCFSQSLPSNCAPNAGQVGPLPAGAFVQNVAHITTGGGFVTKLTIVNLAATSNTIVLNNIHQDGSLMDSTTCTLAGNGTVRLSQGVATNGSETHWALVGSQSPVGVNLFFEYSPSGSLVNTVGFNDVPAKTSYTFPVEFEPGSPGVFPRTLGLAVSNPNAASNTVTVNLLDASATIRAILTLPVLAPFGQTAIDLSNDATIKAALPNANFIGSIVVTGTSPISVVGVGDDTGPFFSEAPMSPPAPSSGSSGSNITATLTLNSSDPTTAIAAGACASFGVAVTGARSTMAVALSPSSDPSAAGYSNVIWNAWVDANDRVTAQFCKFAKGTALLSSALAFNVRVLTTSTSSAAGTVTVAAGSTIPSGGCVLAGGVATGATSSSTIVLSPAGDPGSVGWNSIQFQGFVDSPDHVKGEFCRFAGGSSATIAALNFNVAVLN